MPINVESTHASNQGAPDDLIKITVSGHLTDADYETFVPTVDKAIQDHGKVRILMLMKDFHGWSAGAAWEDFKFDIKHFNDIKRVAVVGEKRWEKWMTNVFKLFTMAKVRYFELSEAAQAKAWVQEAT